MATLRALAKQATPVRKGLDGLAIPVATPPAPQLTPRTAYADVMAGVTPGMVTGVTTEAIGGEKLIVTAGGLDTHIHFICPQICDEAIASGLTTLLGGGTGPASGTTATTCTPSPGQVEMMLQATDDYALNFAFSGKGNTAADGGLMDVLEAGAIGFKLHEDWGTTPAVIDNGKVAPVALHPGSAEWMDC